MPETEVFVRMRGKVSGPYSVNDMHRMVHHGVISRVHEISVDRFTWTRAADYEDLFPVQGDSVPSPPLALPPPLPSAMPQAGARSDGLGELANAVQQTAFRQPPMVTRASLRTPNRTALIVCCAVAGFVALIIVSVIFGKLNRMNDTSEVARLVAEAQTAHANGNLEQAVELLGKAVLKFNADSDALDKARDLQRAYEKELGIQQEPQVAQLIEAARAARASGNNARAISLLTQATKYSNAPNWTEAYELLKQLQPPEPSIARTDDASPIEMGVTMQNYLRIRIGMTRHEVEAILGPGKEDASTETRGFLSKTSIKSYSWDGGDFKSIEIWFVNDTVDTKVQVGL